MNDATDLFWSTWLELCSRRRADGFLSLREVEKTFYAMNFLRGAVERGGFHPYFDMASRQEIEAAKAGFRENGAPQIAILLQKAQDVLFPNGVPECFQDQLNELPCWTGDEIDRNIDPPWAVAIETLNQEFYSQSDIASEVVNRFFVERMLSRD